MMLWPFSRILVNVEMLPSLLNIGEISRTRNLPVTPLSAHMILALEILSSIASAIRF